MDRPTYYGGYDLLIFGKKSKGEGQITLASINPRPWLKPREILLILPSISSGLGPVPMKSNLNVMMKGSTAKGFMNI